MVVSLNYTVDGSPTPVVVLRSNQLVGLHIRLRVGVGHYIINVNKLMSNYSSLQSHVLIKLFQNSCCSFYGATLWNFNTSVYESLCVAWNKALRRVWRLPYMTHRPTCLLGPLNGQIHIADQLNIRFIRFVNRMLHSRNPIVSFIGKYSAIYGNGFIKKNVLSIKWKYDCDITMMNKMCSVNFVREKCKPAVDTVPKIDILRELICVRDGNHNIPGFNRDEVLEMINDIGQCED